jgi:Tfp pilus assembly protein PilF
VSQLLDSLRRGRQPRPAQVARRTAQGDAVLATFGYKPARAGGRSRSRLALMLLLGGAIAAGWVGWKVVGPPEAPVPAGAASVEASASDHAPSPVVAATTGDFPLPALSAPGTAADAHAETARSTPSTGTAPAAPDATPAPVTPPSASLPGPAPIAGARAAAAPLHRPSLAAPGVQAVPPAPTNDLDLAIYYHRAGDFENALEHYRALLRRNELDAQAHNNLGLLYQERNLLDESARELQRAIVIEPRNAGTHNNYGVTLLKLGRADEAQAEFAAALKLSPRSVDAIVNLALAQRDARRPDIARETLLRALSIEPRNAVAHYNLAQLYDQTNQTASAVDHYRRFLENAGAEYASRIAAVRVRIEVLTRDPD